LPFSKALSLSLTSFRRSGSSYKALDMWWYLYCWYISS